MARFSDTAAPLAWAVVFFASAQTAAVAIGLALLRAAAMRHELGTPADVALLCRRSWMALGFGALTMFAAGAAVPGQAAAWQILAGPAVAALAAVVLLSPGRIARRHRSADEPAVHAPVADLLDLVRARAGRQALRWTARPGVTLAPTLVTCAVAAFWWSVLDDNGTAPGAAAAAGIEVACVLVGFVVLGPALGLYAPRRPRRNA